MRTRFPERMVSAVILLWYIIATVGFDVHRSADSGEVYIVPMLCDISCDSIHPEAPCSHHHGEGCDDDEDCCSDTIEHLSALFYDSAGFEMPVAYALSLAVPPVPEVPMEPVTVSHDCCKCIRPAPPDDFMHVFCIMRV